MWNSWWLLHKYVHSKPPAVEVQIIFLTAKTIQISEIVTKIAVYGTELQLIHLSIKHWDGWYKSFWYSLYALQVLSSERNGLYAASAALYSLSVENCESKGRSLKSRNSTNSVKSSKSSKYSSLDDEVTGTKDIETNGSISGLCHMIDSLEGIPLEINSTISV